MTTSESYQAIQAAMIELELTVESKFIPWSQSRNSGEKYPSLNWRVTVKRNGRDVLTTDYSAGCAYCPSYQSQKQTTVYGREAVRMECETGKPTRLKTVGDCLVTDSRRPTVEPNAVDVIHSLTLDADAINYPTYEDWAREFGYDADSRKGEATYRACLEIALKFRAAIGDAGIQQLLDAGQDY